MSTEEVDALRAKRLGDAALEVLLALHEERILIFANRIEDKRKVEFKTKYIEDTLGVYDPQTWEKDIAILSSSSSYRLFESLNSLISREWITCIEASTWLGKLKREQRAQGNKVSAETKLNREEAILTRGYAWEQRYLFTITNQGRQALRNIPARINEFYGAKNFSLGLIITSQTIDAISSNIAPGIYRLEGVRDQTSEATDEEEAKIAAGIYRVERRSSDRIWIRGQMVEGAHEFPKDRTIRDAHVQGRVYGRYIKNEDILVDNASVEDFNRLYGVTIQYQNKQEELIRIAGKKILEVEKELRKAQKALKRQTVKATKILTEQCKPAESDEIGDFVIGEEELSFKL